MSGHNVELARSRQFSSVGAWWLVARRGRVRGGEWQPSDQNEAGRHLHRGEQASWSTKQGQEQSRDEEQERKTEMGRAETTWSKPSIPVTAQRVAPAPYLFPNTSLL